MNYTVKLRTSAQKDLDTLQTQAFQISAKIISSLAQKPRPPKVKKLADSGLWRVRVRNYRIVYAINDTEKTVIIVRVARRKEDTYRGL